MPQTLLPVFPAESTPISDVVSFEKRDGTVWYFHGCMPVFSHGERDYESFRMITSQMVVMGQCRQIAYRAETAMATIMRDLLARSDDARALLREIYTTEADIIPDKEAGTLTVRLHHLTNRLSDQAAKDLAEYLNNSKTIYPGTNLLLHYKLVSG